MARLLGYIVPMPQRTAAPGEINGSPVDRFTIAHLAWGAGFGAVGASWWLALGAALVWDVFVERPLKNHKPSWFPNPTQDTAQHIVTDAAAWMLGWGAVRTMMLRP